MTTNVEIVNAPAPIERRGAVIVLSYNNLELPLECIGTLETVLPDSVSIVFVDNGSEENIAAAIAKEFPWVHALRLAGNTGYAGGNNLGAEYAISRGAERIYILNDDTAPEPGFWEACEHWQHSSKAAILGSVIVYYDEPTKVQEAGARYDWNSMTPTYRGVNALYDESLAGFYDCDAVCGAGVMFSSDAFTALGGFDEDFFLLWEDTDICLRARRHGLEVGTVGESIVRHKGSTSLNKVTGFFAYYSLRNRIWIQRRYQQDRWRYYRFLLKLSVWRLPAAIIRGAQSDGWYGMLAALRAWYDGIFGKFRIGQDCCEESNTWRPWG